MKDSLSKAEIRKDAVQQAVGAAASTAGQVATIVTTAVRDVADALGSFATDLFELRDATRRAEREHGVAVVDEPPEAVDPEEPIG